MARSIRLSRSSVCAGDDLESHEVEFVFTEDESMEAIICRVLQSGYLAYISGGEATWIVEVKDYRLAVIAQQWEKPRFLPDVDKLAPSDLSGSVLYFKYLCQEDPGIVYECLRNGTPLPERYR